MIFGAVWAIEFYNANQLYAMYLRAARAYIHWPKSVFGAQKPMFFDLSERF
jgi:hypothetical protein